MEFFGVPLNDQTLSDAPAPLVLGTCRSFVPDETYEGHFHRLTSGNQTPTQVLRSFCEVLAGLDFDVQGECFEVLVNTLGTQLGSLHVAQRLQEGIFDTFSLLSKRRKENNYCEREFYLIVTNSCLLFTKLI